MTGYRSRASPDYDGPPRGYRSPAPRNTAQRAGGRSSDRHKLAEVGKGSRLNLAAALVAALATTAVTVVVTRKFSLALAGTFFTATSLFLIVAAVAGLGTNIGLTYFIARLRSLGEDNRIPMIMRAAIIPVVVVSISAGALLLVFAAPLAHLMLSDHGGHTGATPASVAKVLRGLAIALPFAGFMATQTSISRGYRDMRPAAIVGQIGLSVGRLIGVLAATAVGSALLLAPLWAAPYIPAAVVAWLWARRIRRNRADRSTLYTDVPPEVAALLALSKPVPSVYSARRAGDQRSAGTRTMRNKLASATPRGFWAFTSPRAVASLAQSVLQQLDIVLVAVIRGPAEAAVYTAATRFLVLGQLGGVAVSGASQPRFTELFTLGDRRGVNAIYQATTAWLVLLLWPLFLVATVYGPFVLTIFGRSYRAGDVVMVILGLAMLLATACGQVDVVLITSGRSSWSLVNGLLTVGINVAVDLALIPKYGIAGAAIGWAAAITIGNLMPLVQLAAVLRLHPFGRGTIVACALTALAFGAVPLALRSALGDNLLALVAGVAAGSVLLAAGMWRFRGVLQLSAMSGVVMRRRQAR